MFGEIPADYVGKYFVMDPETDDLLPNGAKLAPGMIVFCENHGVCTDISSGMENLEEKERFRARIYNRWCRVSDIANEDTEVQFVATYADGTKHTRAHSRRTGWYVRKDSIPWRPSDMRPDEDDTSSDLGVVIVDTEDGAKAVVAKLYENIREYGTVTVANLKELLGIPVTYKDYRRGWVEGAEFTIVDRVEHGFRLEYSALKYLRRN